MKQINFYVKFAPSFGKLNDRLWRHLNEVMYQKMARELLKFDRVRIKLHYDQKRNIRSSSGP